MDPVADSRVDFQIIPDYGTIDVLGSSMTGVEVPINHLWGLVQEHLAKGGEGARGGVEHARQFLAPFFYKLDIPGGDKFDLGTSGEKRYREASLRYLRLLGGMKGVLRTLATEGIQVVVLKGMALVERFYGDPGFRNVGDIDLLVAGENFGRAVAILEESGWKQVGPEHAHNRAGFDSISPWALGEICFRDEKGRRLDLHFHLVPYYWLRRLYHLDMKEIWRKVEPFPGDILSEAWTLSPEHQLIYTCLHLGQHGLISLQNLLDVDLLIRKLCSHPDWDWEHVFHLCRDWDLKSTLYHALLFAKTLFGTPVPAPVFLGLDPGALAKFRLRMLRQPKDLLGYDRARLGWRYPTLTKAALVDRVSDLAATGVGLLYPPKGWRRWRYQEETSLFKHWRHIGEVILRGD